MALTTIEITQGTGTAVEVDSSASGYMQVVKLGCSTLGSTALAPADPVTGMLVNLGTVSATAVPVTNASAQNLNVAVVGSVAVTGTVAISGTPAVTQSGTWNIGTVASITGTVTVGGTVAISGTPAVAQSGTWNIGTVATITNPVTVTGTVVIGNTLSVTGEVTSDQGAPAAVGSAWFIQVSDGTHSATLQSVSGTYALPVKVLAQVGGGYSQQDKTAFTEGTTFVEVIGGVYNDAFGGSPAAGQASVARITPFRALHINLRNQAGTEIGTSTNAVRVDPLGTTPQPVNISLPSGTAISNVAPLWTTPAPNPGAFWSQHIAYTASQTAQAIHTPASGKTVFVQGVTITATTGGAAVIVYDNADSATTELYNGSPAAGVYNVMFATPRPLAAVNNILRYSTGAGVAGDLMCWGYEA